MRNRELQNARQGNSHQSPEHVEANPNLPRKHTNAFCPLHQPVELVQHTDASPAEGSQSRARHSQPWERTPPKNQAGIENQIDDVRHPEQAHGNRRVSRATEDCVVQKQQQHGAASAQADSRVTAADRNDLRSRAHKPQELRRINQARHSDRHRNDESENDGLDRSYGCTFRILLPDAARHHGRRGKTQAHANCEYKAQHRLGESNRCHRVGSQPPHPRHVHDGKQRLEHHLQNHRHGQQENGPVQADAGEVLMRSTHRLEQRRPKRALRLPRRNDNRFRFHKLLPFTITQRSDDDAAKTKLCGKAPINGQEQGAN